MPDNLTPTQRAVKERNAGQTMYGEGQPVGDDLFPDELQNSVPGIENTTTLKATLTGLVVAGTPTEDDWKKLSDDVITRSKALSWLIGDLVICGSEQGWDVYKQFAEKHHMNWRTVEEYAYVCRNVDYSLRNEALSFSHHRAIAGLFDEDNPRKTRQLQTTTLQMAADNNLTVVEFREFVQDVAISLTEGSVASVRHSQPTERPFWQRPIDRLEKDFMKRWQQAARDERQAALKRLKALVRELEKME